MGYGKTIIPFLFYLVLGSHLQVLAVAVRCFVGEQITVYIDDELPPNSAPLKFDCHSKNADIGTHTLTNPGNSTFRWSFCPVADSSFVCNFSWGSKKKTISAFDSNVRTKCTTSSCYWIAKNDGIYFSSVKSSGTKEYDWE